MRLSIRFFLMYFIVLALIGYFVLDVFVSEIKPSVRQATEQTLITTANLLAQTAKQDMEEDNIAQGQLSKMFRSANRQQIQKTPFQEVDYRVYVTNANGIVIFDSSNKALGQNYSRWNDVYLTLRGKYGARSTRSDPNDPSTSVMYVAAPIYIDKRIQGSITVSQDNMVMNPIVFRAEKKIIQAGILLLIIAFLLGLAMVWWFNRSIQALIHYAKAVPNQANLPTPKVSSAELTVLANALGEMRSKLDGKAYVEDYVHSLTHELKSPLAAIKGSAELLQEDLPIAYRQQFANSITTQSLRMQEMIERMLFLVKLERAPQLNLVSCDIQALVSAQIQALQQPSSHLQWQLALSPCTLNIDVFWVEQALQNIIHNAISFSPGNGLIAVKSWQKNGYYTIEITDEGAGIPDFALNKIFDRFYSLSRPNGTKSSGIGLNLVQHIMQLHQGQVHVSNRIRQKGVQVRLLFPLV